MTPLQKILWLIIAKEAELGGKPAPAYPLPDVDEIYIDLENKDAHWDAKEEVRQGGEKTGLASPFSRHYESDAVAAKLPDGSWVGWTYWHGGGKHGEPANVSWVEEAYDVTCKEEPKTVIVKTFSKP